MHRSIDTTEFSTIRKVALGGAVACVLFAAATVLAGPSSNLFFGRWISSTAGAVAPMPEAREGACVGFSSAPVGGFDEDRIYVSSGLEGSPLVCLTTLENPLPGTIVRYDRRAIDGD